MLNDDSPFCQVINVGGVHPLFIHLNKMTMRRQLVFKGYVCSSLGIMSTMELGHSDDRSPQEVEQGPLVGAGH